MARAKHLVVGNWKMYVDSLPKAKELAGKVARTASRLKRTNVVICPPHAFLGAIASGARRGTLGFGAQDVSAETDAKRTGENSAYIVKGAGATHVILGHSERRALGETDAVVAVKASRALKAGLTPIVCVGETERDMCGEYLSLLESQIRGSLRNVPRAKASQLVVAYEPLWAIGKSAQDAVTPALLHEMTLFIKKILVSLYGRSAGTAARIIYGGSVETENVAALIAGGAVDGVLVGHASVDAKEFSAILRAVDER